MSRREVRIALWVLGRGQVNSAIAGCGDLTVLQRFAAARLAGGIWQRRGLVGTGLGQHQLGS